VTLTAASARAVQTALENIDQILDVLVRRRMALVPRERLAELAAGTLPPTEELLALEAPDDGQIELLLAARQAARARRDFAAADGIRNHLRSRGILLEDVPNGIRWKSS
jgi:cysteinyl-tRNA synthetase